MKALVTGGAGFIGSHLVERLLKDGDEVTVVDNLSTGRSDNIPIDSVGADLRNRATAEFVCRGKDIVYHLAAEADISKSVADHFLDLDGVTVMLNLLEGMDKAGVPEMVFTSSSAVYGDAQSIPTREIDPKQPISLYGASKLACENFAYAFAQLSPIRFHAFRLANPVGERNRKGVIWNFVHFLRENPERLPILGDGKQTKAYFYVKDCVDGMLTGSRKDPERLGVFNLGHSIPTTVDRIADLVIEEMSLSNVEKVYAGGSRGWKGDIPVSFLSIEEIGKLGWRPQMPAEDAIRRAIRWTMENP